MGPGVIPGDYHIEVKITLIWKNIFCLILGASHFFSERALPPPPLRNTIGIFSKIVLKKPRVLQKMPSPFKLEYISHSAALLYIQNHVTYQMQPLIRGI
jgi:hypothetical protein